MISYSLGGERKVVAFGPVSAEVDPGLLHEIQESIGKQDVVQVLSFKPRNMVRSLGEW
jgi:hypothetical protein